MMPNLQPEGSLLDGHVALVVGGGRGIGAATAVLLGRLGASVAVTARTSSEVSRVSEQVGAAGGDAIPWTMDVRSPEQVQQLIEQILLRFGRLDHMVYCAGHFPDAAFVWNVRPEDVRVAFDVNVLGPMVVARHVVPIMLEQGQGNLVFVTSALPRWPIPGLGAYSASRAAENALVRTLAAELRGSGVSAEIFTPPPTETDALRQFRAGLPGRRAEVNAMAGEDPDHVAEGIVWLCLSAWRPAAGDVAVRAEYPPPLRGGERFAWRHSW